MKKINLIWVFLFSIGCSPVEQDVNPIVAGWAAYIATSIALLLTVSYLDSKEVFGRKHFCAKKEWTRRCKSQCDVCSRVENELK